jgi:hypothetical protein
MPKFRTGEHLLWLQADFCISRLRWALQQPNVAAAVVSMTVEFCQVIVAPRRNCEDGRKDLQESVCNRLSEFDELLELGVLAIDHVVVDGTRVLAGALNISTTDPVLLIVIRSSLLVYDGGSQSLVSVKENGLACASQQMMQLLDQLTQTSLRRV